LAPPRPAAPAVAATAQTPPVHTVIDAWFVEWFHGAPAMRDTEAFNHVARAKDDLKRRLAEEH